MKRRAFIAALGGAVLTWPSAVPAQERVRRIGVLMGLPANDPGGRSEAAGLNEGLRALGWIEGRNLDIQYKWSGGEPARIQAAAKELVGLGCEVLLGRSTPVVTALMKETRTTPIVFTVVVDPVGNGFVRSFARPGGNVTGFQTYEITMVGKWAQALVEVAPSVRRIAYFHNPATVPAGLLRALETATPSIPVPLFAAPVQSPAEIDAAFTMLAGEPGNGLMVLPDIFMVANRAQIIALAARHGVPAIYNSRLWTASLGLMAYGPDTPDLFRRAGQYVDRILKGEKPGELPVQAPTKYELSINLKTAKALGLTVPPTLLARADEVIE